MLTLFHSLKKAQLFSEGNTNIKKCFCFSDLYPFLLLPTTEVPDTWNKQKVEWHRAKFSSARWFLLYWCASYLPPTMLIPSIYPPKKKVLKGREPAWAVRKGIETKTIDGCDRDWQSRSLKQSGNEGERGERKEMYGDCVHHYPSCWEGQEKQPQTLSAGPEEGDGVFAWRRK